MCPLSASRHKVVCFIPAILGGGIERVFLTLLRHISRKDFELHIASHLVDRPFLSAVPEDVAVHFLKAARLRYIVPGLVRLIWQIRPQTVLSGGYGMNLALMAAQPFLPAAFVSSFANPPLPAPIFSIARNIRSSRAFFAADYTAALTALSVSRIQGPTIWLSNSSFPEINWFASITPSTSLYFANWEKLRSVPMPVQGLILWP